MRPNEADPASPASPAAMRKATLVYLGTFPVLVGALWAILGVGTRLRAPADLTGDGLWHVEWQDETGEGAPRQGATGVSATGVSATGEAEAAGATPGARDGPAAPGETGETATFPALPTQLRIEQSGLFVSLTFAGPGTADVGLEGRLTCRADGDSPRLALEAGRPDGSWQLRVPDYAPPPRGKADLVGSVGDPIRRRFVARWAKK